MGHDGNAEIAEQNLALAPHQEVLWLDVSVVDVSLVRVVQRLGYLLNIADDARQRNGDSRGMALAECSIGGVVDDEVRGRVLDPKIQEAHNMGMLQASNGVCLDAKPLDLLFVQVRAQHFDGNLRFEKDLLP